MTEQEVFVLADRTLNGVVARIADDQWDMPMPASFARGGAGEPPTLREIVNYHAYDDSWVPDMLAGKTIEEAGRDNFKGDLLGATPKRAFAAVVDRACTAVRDVNDLDFTVHTSFGDFSARDYLIQITYFRGLRAHDIARVIGVDSTLPVDLVKGLWEELSPVADEWRELGAFPPGRDPNAA